MASPTGLYKRGKRIHKDLTDAYEFSDVEMQLVLEIAKCADRIDDLEDAIQDEGTMVAGSTGQPVVNPAIAEVRQQQMLLQRLVKGLRLQDRKAKGEPEKVTRVSRSGNVRDRFKVVAGGGDRMAG